MLKYSDKINLYILEREVLNEKNKKICVDLCIYVSGSIDYYNILYSFDKG